MGNEKEGMKGRREEAWKEEERGKEVERQIVSSKRLIRNTKRQWLYCDHRRHTTVATNKRNGHVH